MVESDFVSNYEWLVLPGDGIQICKGTPTRHNTYKSVTADVDRSTADKKQAVYSQWIAQLVQCQIDVPLVSLYKNPAPSDDLQWPIKLRKDVVTLLDQYFADATL